MINRLCKHSIEKSPGKETADLLVKMLIVLQNIICVFFFVGNARERIYRINFIAETRIAECVTRAAGFAANE